MLKRVVPGTSLQEEREELSADDQDDISATQSKNLQNSYKIEGTKNSSTKLLDDVSLKTPQPKN